MKTTIFAFCFLCATAAFGQSAGLLNGNPQPLVMPGNVQHATEHPMALEVSLLSTSAYSYAKGEVPLAELGSLEYQIPLGDVARAYRKEHASAAKAVKVLEKIGG
jgi:hypothetical protein